MVAVVGGAVKEIYISEGRVHFQLDIPSGEAPLREYFYFSRSNFPGGYTEGYSLLLMR